MGQRAEKQLGRKAALRTRARSQRPLGLSWRDYSSAEGAFLAARVGTDTSA
jgi:hypothetical protein